MTGAGMTGTGMTGADPVVAAWREDRLAVLATVARRLGDVSLAEDAVQEAFAAAAVRWPVDGVPDRPGAWLTTTAWRKALDMRRRERFTTAADPRTALAEQAVGDPPPGPATDDVLTLVLACCHPALAPEAQVALTLRHVAGLTARQIAAAFVVPEATMTKRLVRARAKVRDARLLLTGPDADTLPDRLAEVRTVLYLIFNEGYLASGAGPPIRDDLCTEALWLTRQIRRSAPEDDETTGLLALMLLLHARRAARLDAAGELLTLGEQDRGRWDGAALAEARELLATTGGRPPGPYQVEAAIALLHTTADDGAGIDWATIADLYAVLARLAPSPVVEVNRAVAVAYTHGPEAGLAMLAPRLTDPALARYVPLHAAHAHLLDMTGDPRAADVWRHAAGLADNPAQRNRLLARADPPA